MSPGHSNDLLIQAVRDEFSRMRAHFFEACEAAGWPQRQEKGWKGVIRTISYDSQSHLEAALRREADNNGGNMGQPGITDAHVQAGRTMVYGPVVPEPEPEPQVQAEEATPKATPAKK
jgi:hypothetical protein